MERVAIILMAEAIALLGCMLIVMFVRFRVHASGKRREGEAHRGRLDLLERRHRAFMHALPDYYFILARDGTYIDYSVPSDDTFGLPPTSIVGRKLTDVFNVSDTRAFMAAVSEVLDAGRMKVIESSIEFGGKTRYFESRIVALDKDSVLCISRDITDRCGYENALISSIHDKELLIREIHHRVKNNLQIISSLINLQCERFNDDEDRVLMQEMQQRIQTMSQLHEMFCQSGDPVSIDLRLYLSGIIDELRAACRVCTEHVAIENLIQPLSVHLEMALPIGLIVNELVSNALRYAFPGPCSGTVSVSLSSGAEGFLLEVSDDGCGLPADFDHEKVRSLGWLLVNSLVLQLDGTLTIVSGKGTTVRISVPPPSAKVAA